MLAKRIIPCLDVKDGRTVKGVNFVDLKDAGDPVALAAAYSEQGADELVFLDITATHEARDTVLHLARDVARQVNIPFTLGGGIHSVASAGGILQAGCDKVAVNSGAVRTPDLIDDLARAFGNQFVVLAVDARLTDAGWRVYTSGGRTETSRELFSWCKEAQDRGAGEILFTSMDHDGTRQGFALEALQTLNDRLSIPIIASGGAGTMGHFAEAFSVGADAALAASIFHFGDVQLPELKAYLREQGFTMR
jgi:cyclase